MNVVPPATTGPVDRLRLERRGKVAAVVGVDPSARGDGVPSCAAMGELGGSLRETVRRLNGCLTNASCTPATGRSYFAWQAVCRRNEDTVDVDQHARPSSSLRTRVGSWSCPGARATPCSTWWLCARIGQERRLFGFARPTMDLRQQLEFRQEQVEGPKSWPLARFCQESS